MGGNPLVVVEGLVKSQVEVEGYPPSPLSRGLGLRGGEHPVPNNDHSPDRPSQKNRVRPTDPLNRPNLPIYWKRFNF